MKNTWWVHIYQTLFSLSSIYHSKTYIHCISMNRVPVSLFSTEMFPPSSNCVFYAQLHHDNYVLLIYYVICMWTDASCALHVLLGVFFFILPGYLHKLFYAPLVKPFSYMATGALTSNGAAGRPWGDDVASLVEQDVSSFGAHFLLRHQVHAAVIVVVPLTIHGVSTISWTQKWQQSWTADMYAPNSEKRLVCFVFKFEMENLNCVI